MEASAASGSAATPGTRGQVGRQTFDMARELIKDGKKPTEAFAAVAERTGRSAATVATAYYRIARTMPGGAGVKQRARSGRAATAAQDARDARDGQERSTLARVPRAAARPRPSSCDSSSMPRRRCRHMSSASSVRTPSTARSPRRSIGSSATSVILGRGRSDTIGRASEGPASAGPSSF